MTGKEYRYALIRNARRRRRLTIVEAARKVGISPAHWFNLEHGRAVSFRVVREASKMLGLDIRDVISLLA
jgi:hypothetical protein